MKRTITIVIIVAILLGAGIYFYKTSQKNTTPVTSTESNQVAAEDAVSADPTIDATEGDKPGTVAGESTDSKFNKAMTLARKAFVASHFNEALDQYKKALKYDEDDTAYAGLYTVYAAQGKWVEALSMLDKAIALSVTNTDYYKWKIGLMDEKSDASFGSLRAVYEQALPVVDEKTKINLVTYFAGVAERNGEKSYAITYWKNASSIHPENKTVYQTEIERLEGSY
jgi:tetratricopeptide (TPR) repeat protein